jgi:hypothetical protein
MCSEFGGIWRITLHWGSFGVYRTYEFAEEIDAELPDLFLNPKS